MTRVGENLTEGDESEIPYTVSLTGSIKAHLAGLQGFETMALELIQNADDAGASEVSFDVRQDGLWLRNNKKFSSCGLQKTPCPWPEEGLNKGKACDFHAISNIASNNKYMDSSLIGRFGIGFISVYQITDMPTIRSSGYQLTLDPSGKSKKQSIEEIEGTEIFLPWAFDSESRTRTDLNLSAVDKNNIDTLFADFKKISRSCLLFLKNINSIKIMRDGASQFKVSRKIIEENRIHLSFQPDSTEESWYIIHADATERVKDLIKKYPVLQRLQRRSIIQMAFLTGEATVTGKLFAYLPTEQSSPLPCHINGDFFPEQDRKAIVLSGEQHERHWNEMLLNEAAAEIARRLQELRDILDHKALWEILKRANENKDIPHFRCFWAALQLAATKVECAFTTKNEWVIPGDIRMPSKDITLEEERALEHIDIKLAHRDLRSNLYNTLQILGAKILILPMVVDTIESYNKPLDKITANLLCAVMDRMIRQMEKIPVAPALAVKLKKLKIVPRYEQEELSSIDDLYKLPVEVTHEEIMKYIHDLPLADKSFSNYSNLSSYIDLLSLQRLLSELAHRVKTQEDAAGFFGDDKQKMKGFYRLLSSYPLGQELDAQAIMASPILYSNGRFLSAEQAVLPGGFKDPIGKFDILDTSLYDEKSKIFLREVLNVQELTLESYIKEHLEQILDDGLSDEKYVALIKEMASHNTLRHSEVRHILAGLPLVKTMSGEMQRPTDCYFRTDELVEILGDKDDLWADISLFSQDISDEVRFFLERIGMKKRPSLAHALDRLDEITDKTDPDEDSCKAVGHIYNFIYQTFLDENLVEKEDKYAEEIERLRDTDWLPATIAGELTEFWYAPHEIYQHFRSSGFDSQVSVLGIRSHVKGEFLDFLHMPAAPDTQVIINHLIYCSENKTPPTDVVYQLLNERAKNGESELISQLKEHACIYSANLEQFIRPDRIFYGTLSIPGYCFKMPAALNRYPELCEALGIISEPTAETFINILMEMATKYGTQGVLLDMKTKLAHGICLKRLAEKIEEDPQKKSLIHTLEGYPFLLTQAGILLSADDAVLNDNSWLAEPFGNDLDSILVVPEPETRPVIDLLPLQCLSLVTHLETIHIDEAYIESELSDIIAERRFLIMRLFRDARLKTKKAIASALDGIQIFRCDTLQVRSVFHFSGFDTVSPSESKDAFYDQKEKKLYFRSSLGNAWGTPAFVALLSTLIADEDRIQVGASAMLAKNIISASAAEEARADLEQGGYQEYIEDGQELEFEQDDLGDIGILSDNDFEENQSADDSLEENDLQSDELSEFDKENQLADDSEEEFELKTEKGPKSEDVSEKRDFTGSPGANRSENRRSGLMKSGSGNNSRRNAFQELSPSNNNSRKNRMLSYVIPTGDENKEVGEDSHSEEQQERIEAIDEAAIDAACAYEVLRQWEVERKPHKNPGFDLISKCPVTGEKRIIEVKGIDGEWTEFGVKLSRTQFSNAQQYGEQYWLYVVEHALDSKKREIHLIKDIFSKTNEFWFDRNWKGVADGKGGDFRSHFIPGRKVYVDVFGTGTVIEMQNRGIAAMIKIDFTIGGEKLLAFNANTMKLMNEDE